MRTRPRLVLDTNALVSRLLLPASIPGQAVRKAIDEGQILLSEPVLEELAGVLARPKFDLYVSIADRQQFLRLLYRVAQMVVIVHRVRECRDPKDDKPLELALNGEGHVIVSGDGDLLALHPFRGVRIITPRAYLTAD